MTFLETSKRGQSHCLPETMEPSSPVTGLKVGQGGRLVSALRSTRSVHFNAACILLVYWVRLNQPNKAAMVITNEWNQDATEIAQDNGRLG